MSIYLFTRKHGVITATVDGAPLPIAKPLTTTQDGIAWGERSDKSENLAYMILLHCEGEATAYMMYKDFACDILAKLTDDVWKISSEQIKQFIEYRAAMGYEAQQPWPEIKRGANKTRDTIPVIPTPPRFLFDVNESLSQREP